MQNQIPAGSDVNQIGTAVTGLCGDRYGRATRIYPIIENGKLVAIFMEDGRNIHPLIPVALRAEIKPESFEEEAIRLHAMADADNFRPEMCYFIGGDDGAIKIGKSVAPDKRLRQIQINCPVPIRILALAHGGGARERAYHAQFGASWSHGEWFARTPAILAEIARLNATRPADLGRG